MLLPEEMTPDVVQDAGLDVHQNIQRHNGTKGKKGNTVYKQVIIIQCCGTGMLIPGPGSKFFPSRIQGSKRHRILDPGF
jgi:hypothetical protein